MTYSFSRISCYDRCPHAFYLEYIKVYYNVIDVFNDLAICSFRTESKAKEYISTLPDDKIYSIEKIRLPQAENAFAQYGTLMHGLLEKYAKDEVLIFELLNEYERAYADCVTCNFPPNKYVVLADTYYENGYNYFAEFEGFGDWEIIDVEKKIDFKIDKHRFVGYIDLVVKNKDGEVKIIDHKSKKLSKPQKRTWEDIDRRRRSELYQYLRQLYIYCIPFIEQEDVIPDYLCFNCFREDKLIKIPFDMDDYKESKGWALDIIKRMYVDEHMDSTYDNSFFCNFLCGVRHYCPNSDRFLGEMVE